MTDRERFTAVLKGEQPDRIPWTPRLDIWFSYHKSKGSLPERYRDFTLEDVRTDLETGMSARKGRVYREIYCNCSIRQERKGDILSKYLITPIGTLTAKYRVPPGETGFREAPLEHFIKSADDYAVMEYFYRDIRYEESYREYENYNEEVGERALPLCITTDVPMGLILRELTGYNRAFYELADNTERVEELHGVMLEKWKELQQVILDSPGQLFLHGTHFDSQMTPPPVFRKYILPYLRDFCRKMDVAGKWLAIHQDADASLLLELIKESGVHIADCLCTYPMVPLTLEKAMNAWKDKVVVWGGIPSTILCPMLCGENEFRKIVADTVEKARGRRVILAVADNVMPEADIERVRYISETINGKIR